MLTIDMIKQIRESQYLAFNDVVSGLQLLQCVPNDVMDAAVAQLNATPKANAEKLGSEFAPATVTATVIEVCMCIGMSLSVLRRARQSCLRTGQASLLVSLDLTQLGLSPVTVSDGKLESMIASLGGIDAIVDRLMAEVEGETEDEQRRNHALAEGLRLDRDGELNGDIGERRRVVMQKFAPIYGVAVPNFDACRLVTEPILAADETLETCRACAQYRPTPDKTTHCVGGIITERVSQP